MSYSMKILMTRFVTHDVKSFIIEKPKGYKYRSGQSISLAINQKGWLDKKRPFTFTGLPEDKVLELTIKGYFDRDGVTKKLHGMKVGDEVLIDDPWGSIEYRGDGVFIAGGAGITPFMAIFRDLARQGKIKKNILFFANKKEQDIIFQKELEKMFEKENLEFFLSQEKREGYKNGHVDKNFLEKRIKNYKQKFYLCGPPPMVMGIKTFLSDLGADISEIIL